MRDESEEAFLKPLRRLEEVFLFSGDRIGARKEPYVNSSISTPAQADIPGRYSRQILFDGIGPGGQAKIIGSRVVLVGCGALGTVQASLLVRAGVGTVRIIDRE